MIAGPTRWEMFVGRFRSSTAPLKPENDPMQKTFGYMRVSTQDQNLDLQRDALEKAGATDIIDEKASGAKADRPELLRMLSLAREGDKIVVWRLDRLARSMKHLIEIIEDLDARGIEFQSVTENIDTSSAGGKLVFGIFASLAEFERSLIRERTVSGLEAAKARGRVGGRPKALNDNQIADARLMREHGRTLTEIAQHFDIAVGTVHKALAR